MKNLEKRFGSIAVEKGFITVQQLGEALMIQASENIESGRHRLLGQIMVDEGMLSEWQRDEILETMSQTMIYALSTGR